MRENAHLSRVRYQKHIRADRALDFAHAEVRERYRILLEEMLSRYDMDGIELDFCRHPLFFGIGRELDHRVRRVSFNPEASPAAVLELRYEYHDALVRLGVLPHSYARHEDPLERRERARGFDDLDFAPDPYR